MNTHAEVPAVAAPFLVGRDAPWGAHLTIVTTLSREYEPGFYALFNSAIENGFAGQLLAVVSEPDRLIFEVGHPQLRVLHVPRDPGDFLMVWRLKALAALPPGTYVLMGADFVVERPCGFLFDAIDDALVASSVPHVLYDLNDVFVHRQCRELGWSDRLQPGVYVCSDFLGFKLPRDREFLCQWRDGSEKVLAGVTRPHQHPTFLFCEQDVLNVLIRQPHVRSFTVSARQMEFGNQGNGIFHDRPFPAGRQGDLKPVDQLKYLVHGLNSRRPWLAQAGPKWKARLNAAGVLPLYRRTRGRLFPYERAWAYYACREDTVISVSFWAERYGFSSYRRPLWRRAYGL